MHKVKEREYESEWRLLSEKLNNDPDEYGTDIKMKPSALYCGPRMSKERRDELSEICSKNGIDFYTLDEKYDIVRK